MSSNFLPKKVSSFCALAAVGFLLFAPSVFAAETENVSDENCNYLESYLSPRRDNDPAQVLKLQTFLKEKENLDVPLNGVFDPSTLAAVKKFQTKYSEEILKPWKISNSTGNVSVTTRHKINDLSCGVVTSFSFSEKKRMKEIMQNYGVTNKEIDTRIDEMEKTGLIAANVQTYDITKINVPKIENSPSDSGKLFENKTKPLSPLVTIDSLSNSIAAENATEKSQTESGESENLATASGSESFSGKLSKNGLVAGIPLELNSKFSLPIIIAVVALFLIQLYFFGKTSLSQKGQQVTRKN